MQIVLYNLDPNNIKIIFSEMDTMFIARRLHFEGTLIIIRIIHSCINMKRELSFDCFAMEGK